MAERRSIRAVEKKLQDQITVTQVQIAGLERDLQIKREYLAMLQDVMAGAGLGVAPTKKKRSSPVRAIAFATSTPDDKS